jgi:hypothetical protein
MTERKKKLYRRLSGAALLLLASLAIAPIWWATAGQVPPGTDECCELGNHQGTAHPALAQPKSHLKPHLIFNDVAGDIIENAHSGGHGVSGHSHRGGSGGHGEGGGPAAMLPDSRIPTFANNNGGPASPLVEHDSPTYQPAFNWHGGLRGLVLGAAGPGRNGSAPGASGPDGNSNPHGNGAGDTGNHGGDTPGNGDTGNGNPGIGDAGNNPGDTGNPGDNGGQPSNPNQPDKPVASVPEPPAAALLVIGAIGLVVMRRRRS